MIITKITDDAPSLDILGWKIETPSPSGSFAGVCLDVDTREKFEREVFGKPGIYETIPAVRILIGVKEGDTPYLVQTNVIKASGHPKSNFYKLVENWIGEFAMNFDPRALVNKPCNIVIERMTSARGTVYGKIKSITAIPSGLESACPTKDDFNDLMVKAGANVGSLPIQEADPLKPAPTPEPKVEKAIEPKMDQASPANGEDVPF